MLASDGTKRKHIRIASPIGALKSRPLHENPIPKRASRECYKPTPYWSRPFTLCLFTTMSNSEALCARITGTPGQNTEGTFLDRPLKPDRTPEESRPRPESRTRGSFSLLEEDRTIVKRKKQKNKKGTTKKIALKAPLRQTQGHSSIHPWSNRGEWSRIGAKVRRFGNVERGQKDPAVHLAGWAGPLRPSRHGRASYPRRAMANLSASLLYGVSRPRKTMEDCPEKRFGRLCQADSPRNLCPGHLPGLLKRIESVHGNEAALPRRERCSEKYLSKNRPRRKNTCLKQDRCSSSTSLQGVLWENERTCRSQNLDACET